MTTPHAATSSPSSEPLTPPSYPFFAEFARIVNAGQSRSILLTGNVADLFHVRTAAPGAAPNANTTPLGEYHPLLGFLAHRCAVPGVVLLVYELNGVIRIQNPDDAETLKQAWVAWQAGSDADTLQLLALSDAKRQKQREALAAEYDRNLRESIGQPSVAFEFLRQLTILSRATGPSGRHYLDKELFIIVEAADMVVPAGKGDIADLAPADRQRVLTLFDWFTDPAFMNARDTVVLIAESRSTLHPRITGIPSVLSVSIPAPDAAAREHYIRWFLADRSPPPAPSSADAIAPIAAPARPSRPLPNLAVPIPTLAQATAGLSLHALRQLLLGAAHTGEPLGPAQVTGKVVAFIASQLGEDVVEFKKPEHSLDDVIGFTKLKAFLREELIPRFRATGSEALPGAAVAGPIGGGKTFIFEAVAAALDLPVLTLKNIRSQWYGQTDVIFERLRRVLEALGKCVIFVDEADTQFGGVGADAHETERRLTGKIQQMMSDPKLRGRVIWLLMTARIHLLSPDIRRPGRVGDLIIPVLDPDGDDRTAFLNWTLRGMLPKSTPEADITALASLTTDYSAAAYASLRSNLKARQMLASAGAPLTVEQIRAVIADQLQPAIGPTRRYQTLQALINCTRRALLPDPNVTDETRLAWENEIRLLESRGIR